MFKKIELTAKTSFSEIFTADQIWGQFIWAVSDLFGKEIASEVVDHYISSPPVLFSAASLDGYLPAPFFMNSVGDPTSDIGRHNKKIKWVELSEFHEIQQNPYVFSQRKLTNSASELISNVDELHVSIDRRTFTAVDGGLYNSQYLSLSRPLIVYLSIEENENYWVDLISKVCEYWSFVGLGGDRNVGHGCFEVLIKDLSDIESRIFSFDKGNTFMTLSRCFGKDLCPLEYAIDVYSGISRQGFENSNIKGYRKSPIIQYKEGSLFKAGHGTIAQGTGYDSRICSYGYVFPVSMKYKDAT